MVDRKHRDGKGRLKRCVLVQIVDDDLRISVAFQFHNNASFFSRLIAHSADVGEDLVVDQICDPLDEFRAVYVVGNLCDDDSLTAALHFLDTGFSPDAKRTLACFEVLFDRLGAKKNAARWKIRSFDVGHKPFNVDFRIIDLCADCVDDFR